jgi:hypothetical protein
LTDHLEGSAAQRPARTAATTSTKHSTAVLHGASLVFLFAMLI